MHFALEFVEIILPVLGVSTIVQARRSLYFWSLLLILVLHCVNKVYFIHFYLKCSLVYDDETKKNASAVLTMGTVDSSRKGYISLFRSIVVLYTFLCCDSLISGSLPSLLWISRCSLASTPRHIFMASPSYSTWISTT